MSWFAAQVYGDGQTRPDGQIALCGWGQPATNERLAPRATTSQIATGKRRGAIGR